VHKLAKNYDTRALGVLNRAWCVKTRDGNLSQGAFDCFGDLWTSPARARLAPRKCRQPPKGWAREGLCDRLNRETVVFHKATCATGRPIQVLDSPARLTHVTSSHPFISRVVNPWPFPRNKISRPTRECLVTSASCSLHRIHHQPGLEGGVHGERSKGCRAAPTLGCRGSRPVKLPRRPIDPKPGANAPDRYPNG
jgi:hypothetical protein